MRPIDRQAPIDVIADAKRTDPETGSFVGWLADCLVEYLKQPNEWVSVEDRLPAENESVLCITNGKPRENITLIAAYQIGSWNATEGWIIDEWPDWEDAEVSWWMTLPEPPERRPIKRG